MSVTDIPAPDAARKPRSVSRKMRFEVFKRDKFTCQFCGAQAPKAVLHADHLHPHAKGGACDLLNLVTACEDCNGGKGARTLDDSSVLDKQRAELQSLAERREQLEMMLEWRTGLLGFEDECVVSIEARIIKLTQLALTGAGRMKIRRLMKKHAPDEILAAVDRVYAMYLEFGPDGVATKRSAELAFNRIAAAIRWNRSDAEKPYMTQVAYVQGILRNRLHKYGLRVLADLERWFLESDIPEARAMAMLTTAAKASDSLEGFWELLSDIENEYWEGDASV